MDGLCGETAQYTTSAIIHRKNRANNLHLRDDETLLYFLASTLTLKQFPAILGCLSKQFVGGSHLVNG